MARKKLDPSRFINWWSIVLAIVAATASAGGWVLSVEATDGRQDEHLAYIDGRFVKIEKKVDGVEQSVKDLVGEMKQDRADAKQKEAVKNAKAESRAAVIARVCKGPSYRKENLVECELSDIAKHVKDTN